MVIRGREEETVFCIYNEDAEQKQNQGKANIDPSGRINSDLIAPNLHSRSKLAAPVIESYRRGDQSEVEIRFVLRGVHTMIYVALLVAGERAKARRISHWSFSHY